MYERTFDQNEMLGLNDINTENYKSDDADNGDSDADNNNSSNDDNDKISDKFQAAAINPK